MQSTTQQQGGQLKRTMKTRHLIMLSLGGVIVATGLFFNTGYIISTTGAAGTLLAYLIGCPGGLAGDAVPWRTVGGDARDRRFPRLRGAISWPGDGLYRGVALLVNVDGGAGVELHRGGILHAVLVPAGRRSGSGAWCSAQ